MFTGKPRLMFTRFNVRRWMRDNHVPGQTVRELAEAAAAAFEVGAMLTVLDDDDHWAFELAAYQVNPPPPPSACEDDDFDNDGGRLSDADGRL